MKNLELHDYGVVHNEGTPYCIFCIQYIESVMKKPHFQKEVEA